MIKRKKNSITLTKADMYMSLYKTIGYSRKNAVTMVNSVFDTICDKLCSGYHVKLSGFGNFMLRDKNARIGRDPKTGESIDIKERRVVVFHSSSVLKNILNDNDQKENS